MGRFLAKKIRRTLGLIVCVALVVTAAFQNHALANAEGSGVGEGAQDNRFYLSGIKVSADYNSELLAGQTLTDGEHEYVIDAEGKIQFDKDIMTVSGGDAGSISGGNEGSVSGGNAGSTSGGDAGSVSGGNIGSTSGGDAGSVSGGNVGSVSGDPLVTDPNYYYIRSDRQQLELSFKETDQFFGMEAAVVIQPNDPEGIYTMELNRKFNLAVPVVQLKKEDGSRTTLTQGSYGYSYADIEDVTAPVRAGDYEASVTWMGIVSRSISYDCTGNDIPVMEYRDYIIYGLNGDFYITATENGQEKDVDILNSGKDYAVQSIVIRGRESQDNENPFNYYRIMGSGNSVLAEGYVDTQDTVISNIADKSGSIMIHMYIRDNDAEHEASNTVSLTTDNAAPELVELSYLTGSAQQKGEEPRKIEIAPDGSLQFTDADTIMDQDTITLYLTVSEASGIGKAVISYIVDGDKQIKTDTLSMAESDTQRGEYSTVYTITDNVNLTQIKFAVTDILDHQATWGTLSAIVDNTPPRVAWVHWSKNGELQGAIEKDSHLYGRAIELTFGIDEKNQLETGAGTILLIYKENGIDKRIVLPSDAVQSTDRQDGSTVRHQISYTLPEKDAVYEDFELYFSDELGNCCEYKGDWSATTDNTPPKVTQVHWSKNGEQQRTIEKGSHLYGRTIELIFSIEEENPLEAGAETIELNYKENGVEKMIMLFPDDSQKTDNQDGGNVPYQVSYTLPDKDALYEDFELSFSDEAGNRCEYRGDWLATTDNTPPDVKRVYWSKDGGEQEIIEADSQLYGRTIELIFGIEEKNPLEAGPGSIELSYTENDIEKKILLSTDDVQKAEGQYRISYTLPDKNAIYKDFEMHFSDEAGNRCEYKGGWSATTDDTLPQIGSVSWISSEKPTQESLSGKALLVDKAEITLTMSVAEKNIEKAELYYLDKDGKIVASDMITQNGSDSQENFSFKINDTKYNYQNLILRVTDRSGNVATYGDRGNDTLQIIIDGEAPELLNLKKLQPKEDAWYHRQDDAIQYSFDIRDYSRIDRIQMIAEPENGEKIVWDLKGDYKEDLKRGEDGYFTYHITTNASCFTTAADQDLKYYFVITDEWGNSRDTSKGEPPITAEMRVDNTAPSSIAYVKFQGDLDRFYDTLDELVDIDGRQYQYGSQSGSLFNNSRVDLTVYVADRAADDAVDQAASGIKQVKVTYHYTDTSINGTKDQSRVLIYGEGGNSRAISEKVNVTADGKTMLMDAVSFTLTVTGSQQITAIDSIEITDHAGNVTVIREYAGTSGLAVDYVLDNKAPELSHAIPAGSSSYTKDGNTYYYNRAAEMSVTIAENNFYPAEVSSSLRAGGADRTMTMSEFQNMGNYHYRSRFTMNEGDGRYRFSLSYTDRSGNAVIFRGDGGETYLSGGVYTSPVLVLDTVEPNVSIRYYQGGNDITDSVYGGKCVNGDVSAVISITEVNFDPTMVQIDFSATDAADNHAYNIAYDPEGWSQSGNAYSYTIPCAVEGRYSLTASCVDKAGNRSNNVPVSDFIVDKTVPAVAISYDTSVENGYYNTDRVAAVTVTEQNFSEEAADYMITSTGAQPQITGWSHTAGNGCGEYGHVKSCRWSSQVIFAEDADYSFTFGCVDMAGNASAFVEEQAFIIDRTLPVIQVSYDNNDSPGSYFYKEGRTATITVVEHNFSGSEVNLAVSSPDGDTHAPSAWREAGADTYVCQIAYDTDGDYTFDISCVDPAGNEAESYEGDRFVIDMTAPELEISGVNDRSANNGVVAPVITCSDKNYDAEQTKIRITGVSHGQITPEHNITTNDDGQTIAYMDFSHVQELDDLYTLEAVITDKAGNSTTDSIMFSVNRFGSTYLFSRETQEVLEHYYTNQGPALNITEINVDTLEHQEISYSCDGNTVVLEQGVDYTVQESGSEYEWKQYTYDIPGSNFDTEGVYVVTLQSVDRASNDVTNRIKEKNIEFIVDKTAPSVVLGGIENGGSYAETSRSLTIDAVDNIYLKSVDIYLNSRLAVSFDEDTLSEYHGVVSYEIKETGSVQTAYVVARDAAGNETQTNAISFLISSNAFIRWFYNKPLFFGSIAAVAVVAGGIVSIMFVRKKRKMEGRQ